MIEVPHEKKVGILANLLVSIVKGSPGRRMQLQKESLVNKGHSLMIDGDGEGGLILWLESEKKKARRRKAA